MLFIGNRKRRVFFDQTKLILKIKTVRIINFKGRKILKTIQKFPYDRFQLLILRVRLLKK